jgi:hypothetical protein
MYIAGKKIVMLNFLKVTLWLFRPEMPNVKRNEPAWLAAFIAYQEERAS